MIAEVEALSRCTGAIERRGKFHALADRVTEWISSQPEARIGDDFFPPRHVLTDGLYSRALYMPAGSLVVSKIHRKQHQYVVLYGKVLVLTETGQETVSGGYQGVTEPGTRRILYVQEDTLWITFHPTQETDLEKIEADLILPRHLLPEPSASSLSCPGS